MDITLVFFIAIPKCMYYSRSSMNNRSCTLVQYTTYFYYEYTRTYLLYELVVCIL